MELTGYLKDILSKMDCGSAIYIGLLNSFKLRRTAAAPGQDISRYVVEILDLNGLIGHYPNNQLPHYRITPAGRAALTDGAK